MTPWVATHSDLTLSGLSPAACVPDARDLVSVNLAPGLFEVTGHGFIGGEQVRFAARAGNSIPTGLAPAVYYAVAPTNGNPDFFSLSPLLVPYNTGIGKTMVIENWIPKIDAIMAQWTSLVVASATAYKPPWTTPPTWAPMLVARLAAPTVASVLRIPSSRYDVSMVERGYAEAKEMLAQLRLGQVFDDGIGPIDAASTPGTFDTMVAHNRYSGARPVVPWQRGTL